MLKMVESNKEKFDWASFKNNENICVHCQTLEEAKEFCILMHNHGMKWRGGKSYAKDTKWNNYIKRTCYYGDGTFCDIDYANKYNHTILKFSLLDFD